MKYAKPYLQVRHSLLRHCVTIARFSPSQMVLMPFHPQASDVVEAFHATDKKEKWVQCNVRATRNSTLLRLLEVAFPNISPDAGCSFPTQNTVGSQMWSPQSRPSIELVPALLEKMPMLWFAGDVRSENGLCNIRASVSLTLTMEQTFAPFPTG